MESFFDDYIRPAVGRLIEEDSERSLTKYAIGAAVGTSSLMYLYKRYHNFNRMPSTGKAVFITGCDTGFGNAIAIDLIRRGYVVFAGCLNKKSAEKAFANILSIHPTSFHVVELDVTDDDHFESAVSYVNEWLEENPSYGLWGIVCNAGIGTFSPAETLSMKMFISTYDVNVFGVVRTIKSFLPLLRKNHLGDGRVVLLASIFGELTPIYFSCYASSKRAVIHICDTLRAEVAPFNIKVSVVCPDFYTTPLTSAAILPMIEERLKSNPKEILDAYGGETLMNKARKTIQVTFPKLASTDLTPVTDSIHHALASPSPNSRYYPIRWFFWIAKFLTFIAPELMARAEL